MQRLPRACALIAALPLMLLAGSAVDPARALECHSSKGARADRWAWREIDGRHCWYKGRRGLDKRLLHWPAPAAEQTSAAQAPPVKQPPPAWQPPASPSAPWSTFEERWWWSPRGDH